MTKKQRRGTWAELKAEITEHPAAKAFSYIRMGLSAEEAEQKAYDWERKKLKEAQLLYFGVEI